MRLQSIFIIVIVALFSASFVSAQSQKQKQLEAKRQRLLKEISQLNSLNRANKTKEKSVVSQVEDANYKIRVRQNLIKVSNEQANQLTRDINNNQKKIISNVDMLLPNSKMELDALNTRLGFYDKEYSIVYNAIDTLVFDEIKKENTLIKNNNLIVFVARIDPRKNQINFLKAIYDTKYEVIFIYQKSKL